MFSGNIYWGTFNIDVAKQSMKKKKKKKKKNSPPPKTTDSDSQ